MTRTGPITLRQATPSDAPAIHAMILELADSLGASDRVTSSADDVRAALAGAEPGVHAILAEHAGRAVGVAVFFLTFSTWRGARGVYLQDLFVSADAQATGLGRRLVDSVVAWARERGASHLRLSVDRGNSAARAFYEALGMKHSEQECVYGLAGPAFVRRDPNR